MPISQYLAQLRQHIGHGLLLLPSAGALIRDEQHRVLLAVNRDTGLLMLPGGALDPGESPKDAVIREVHEETGLKVVPLAVAAVIGPWSVHYPNGDRVDYTVTIFLCRRVGGRLEARDGEATGFQWIEPDTIPYLGYPTSLWTWRIGDATLF